jgi:hypothetical protein
MLHQRRVRLTSRLGHDDMREPSEPVGAGRKYHPAAFAPRVPSEYVGSARAEFATKCGTRRLLLYSSSIAA